MDNMNDGEAVQGYEAIAREAGYMVIEDCDCNNLYYWKFLEWDLNTQQPTQKGYSSTEADCWKACCVENRLC